MQDPFGLSARPPLNIRFVDPDLSKVIVLERINDVPEPDYRVHGRTRCYSCGKWCHLGHKTHELVLSGGATPLCRLCAAMNCDPDQLVGNVDDKGHSHR